MGEALQSDFKEGTCDWCGEKGAVYADNELCEDCDIDTVVCSICEERQGYDSSCRHVFQDGDCSWTGSGAFEPSEEVKTAFRKLLAAMPEGFAAALRVAIKSGRFHTWMVAPIIGGGDTLTMHGMPYRGGKWRAWGDAMIELGESERAEELRFGYRWLVSLYDTETPDANARTLAWIDEWLIGGPA